MCPDPLPPDLVLQCRLVHLDQPVIEQIHILGVLDKAPGEMAAACVKYVENLV